MWARLSRRALLRGGSPCASRATLQGTQVRDGRSGTGRDLQRTRREHRRRPVRRDVPAGPVLGERSLAVFEQGHDLLTSLLNMPAGGVVDQAKAAALGGLLFVLPPMPPQLPPTHQLHTQS